MEEDDNDDDEDGEEEGDTYEEGEWWNGRMRSRRKSKRNMDGETQQRVESVTFHRTPV